MIERIEELINLILKNDAKRSKVKKKKIKHENYFLSNELEVFLKLFLNNKL